MTTDYLLVDISLSGMLSAGRAGVGRCGAVWGGVGCGPNYCGAGRAAGYDVAKLGVRADCGPSYCGARRAAGQETTNMRGGLQAEL